MNVNFEVADVTRPLVAVGELTVVKGPHGGFVVTRGHVTEPLGCSLRLEYSNGAY